MRACVNHVHAERREALPPPMVEKRAVVVVELHDVQDFTSHAAVVAEPSRAQLSFDLAGLAAILAMGVMLSP